MDNTDVIAAHVKTMAVGGASYLGFTLNEWAAIVGIIFAILNTIAVLPATIKAIRGFLGKEPADGSK